MWLAPNVITFAGFMFVITPHIVSIILYGNGVEGYVDDGFCVFAGVCFFMNNTLDNCDGKQARRTGSGSPMGMLFDHGLDAVVAVFANF